MWHRYSRRVKDVVQQIVDGCRLCPSVAGLWGMWWLAAWAGTWPLGAFLLAVGVVSEVGLYYFVVYLYVNGSGLITSVGEERANLSAVIYL